VPKNEFSVIVKVELGLCVGMAVRVILSSELTVGILVHSPGGGVYALTC